MKLKVEVFSVGKWNGLDFTKEDLMLIAAAFTKLKENHKVPLKFGHNEEQPFTDGQPALGWAEDVEVIGDKLVAHLDSIPSVVFNAIENRLYRHVSIELDFGVEHKGEYYPFVLSGIALLGADIPAVNNIGDLTQYMARELKSSKRAVFTAIEKTNRRLDVDIKEMQAKLDALTEQLSSRDSQIADLAKEKAQFERDNTDILSKLKLQEELAQKREFDRKKSDLESNLESLVSESKITPAQREAFMAQYKEDDSTIKMMEENLKVLGMFNADKTGEQGSNESKEDEGKTPAQILFERAKKHSAKHDKTFRDSVNAVMEADKDLAREYIMMT